MYLLYCEEFKHSERDFWNSSYSKIEYVIDYHYEKLTGGAADNVTVNNMHEIPGF